MAAIVTYSEVYMLVHPTVRIHYDFHPHGENVEVIHTDGRKRSHYTVPTDEARDLWTRLVKKGYERF